jgi:hypothetical protein
VCHAQLADAVRALLDAKIDVDDEVRRELLANGDGDAVNVAQFDENVRCETAHAF